jgi:O-methyltransferase
MVRLRRGTGSLYRKLQSIRFLLGRDRRAVAAFLAARWPVDVPLKLRIDLIARFVATTNDVRAYHTQAEMLTVADRILALAGRPGLKVVECGAGKGGSSAKLSLVTLLAGGRLVVFDSFRGIPENDEVHENLDGRPVRFRAGAFSGTIGQVRRAIERYGAPEVCELKKGWFHETLPSFRDPVDVVLLDVDLVASTRTCLVNLFPRVRPGGVVFTQDGHLRATVDLLASERFWRDEVGVEPPLIPGLGRDKLLEIRPRG